MGTPVAPGNRGVMALGASIVDLCLGAAPNATVKFLQVHKPADDVVVRTKRGDFSIPVVTCRMSPRAQLRDQLLWILVMSITYRLIPIKLVRDQIRQTIPWIDAVLSADLVGDVRGGDSFSDIYGLKRFCLAFLPVWTVLILKGSILHFPQTYGPFKSKSARMIARFLLRRSSAVIARDPESQRIAQELVGDHLKVKLSPDVAFALCPRRPDVMEVDPPLADGLPGDTIGINVNGLMLNGGYTGGNTFGLKLDYGSFLRRMIVSLLEKYPADILLVPHTFAIAGDPESDNHACWQLREDLPAELQPRIRIVTGDYDAHELKGIIGQCGFFIGSRMHSCIAALSQGVPCVGVAYSMKFKGVFDSVGKKDWVIDARNVDDEGAVSSILTLYSSREAARKVLSENADLARGRLQEVFGEIVPASHEVTSMMPHQDLKAVLDS